MRLLLLVLFAVPLASPPMAVAQGGGLDPASLLAPLENSWPTYSGDYSGRRYSKLTQVNIDNVQQLTLAWTRTLDSGMPALEGANAPDFTGGEGEGDGTRPCVGARRT